MIKHPKYIIGTGWWCPENPTDDDRQKLLGSDVIRSASFHALWYQSICKNTSPDKILIVDSNSPILPKINPSDHRIEFISLNVNAKHATNHTGKFCGWTRAVILGLEYALMCDTDYFVYIEQDALLSGDRIIEHCIKHMNGDYLFGDGKGTPQLLQQSFFIIKQSGINRFLRRLNTISSADNKISPEDKFYIAASKWPLNLTILFFKAYRKKRKNRKKAVYSFILKLLNNFDYVPFGYGRKRPIDFHNTFYYFQHASTEELNQHLIQEGLLDMTDNLTPQRARSYR